MSDSPETDLFLSGMIVMIKPILHILFGVVTFATGVAVVTLITAPVPTGAQAGGRTVDPVLRPVEKVPLSRNVDLSCYDLNIAPVWAELKEAPDFEESLARFPGQYDCSDLVSVERKDLNGDRRPEFIAWGKNAQLFCGATGNCSFWVFGMRGPQMVRLLSSGGIGLEFGRAAHNGYRDIVVRFNGGNYPDRLDEYRFTGSEFRRTRCYQQDKQTSEKWREDCV